MPFALARGRLFDHSLARESAKNQSFEERIAGEAVGAMHARRGSLSRSIQAGKGSAALQICFHPTDHIMRGGANRRQVARQVQAAAQAGLVNSREALLQKFLALFGHVQVNVGALGALHLADNGARHHIARS